MQETKAREQASNKGLIELTVDEEVLYGSTLEIKYLITVANIGEVDYEGNDFYYKGTGANQMVTTTAKQLVDYIGYQIDTGNVTRNNITFSSENNSDWDLINQDELKELLSSSTYNQSKEYTQIITTKEDAAISQKELIPILADSTNAKTIQSKIDRDPLKAAEYINESTKSVAATTLTVSQIVAYGEKNNDLTFNNLVEIVNTSNKAGRKMELSVAGNQDLEKEPTTEIDTDDSEEVKIMPPFGQVAIHYALYFTVGTILIAGIAITIMVVMEYKKKQE